MPLTNTLETSRRLTQAGVPAAQAEVLSELFESTAQDALRELKATVAQEGERTRAEMKELELRIAERLRAQMLWFFGMLTGLLGLTIAILKFLP